MIYAILTQEQRRASQENLELDFAFSLHGVSRFRCNVYRQRNSIAFTARHVSEDVPSAAELGIPDFLREFGLKNQGLILITGPNGHGKSTTLAWLVVMINRDRRSNIITIEDPVEFTHRHKNSNVNQREVGERHHLLRGRPSAYLPAESRRHRDRGAARLREHVDRPYRRRDGTSGPWDAPFPERHGPPWTGSWTRSRRTSSRRFARSWPSRCS